MRQLREQTMHEPTSAIKSLKLNMLLYWDQLEANYSSNFKCVYIPQGTNITNTIDNCAQ